MNFEDHFSELSDIYLKYRPQYPPALFEYLAGLCNLHRIAWDCGTGNGQAALELTNHFDKVYATDGSKEQLNKAPSHPKITYKVETSENVSLADSSVDLLTVAVAVHWFDFEKFYAEVKRVLKPGGLIAVWCYHIPTITPQVNAILEKYYKEILKGYWPERFHFVDERYKTLPFPFDEIKPPEFEMTTEWDLDQLTGFLNSWSATKNYKQAEGQNPLQEIWDELSKAWGDKNLKHYLYWPLNIRIGKV